MARTSKSKESGWGSRSSGPKGSAACWGLAGESRAHKLCRLRRGCSTKIGSRICSLWGPDLWICTYCSHKQQRMASVRDRTQGKLFWPKLNQEIPFFEFHLQVQFFIRWQVSSVNRKSIASILDTSFWENRHQLEFNLDLEPYFYIKARH